MADTTNQAPRNIKIHAAWQNDVLTRLCMNAMNKTVKTTAN